MMVFVLQSCASKERVLNPGMCLEKPFGAYTYRILRVEKDKYLAHKIGLPGKFTTFLSKKERLIVVACP